MTAIIDGVIKDEIPFPAIHLIFFPFFFFCRDTDKRWQNQILKKKKKKGGSDVGGKKTTCLSFALIREEGRLIPEIFCVLELLKCNFCKNNDL